MSSIIDALKKSDQTRKNDPANTLNNISFSDQPPAKSRRGFWLLVFILLLVAVGVYGWQQGWHNRLGTLFNEQAADSQEAVTTPATAQPATDQSIPAEQAPAQMQQVTDKLTPPSQNEIKAQSAQLVERQATQVIKADQQTAQTQAIEQAAADSNTLTVVENRSSGTTSVDTDQPKDQAAEKQPAEPASQPESRSSLEPKLKQDYLLIHQLDFAIRKNIPPVKISIHIYDPDPENRMLMINGEKFAIGDSIEGLVTVRDIVPEGVVLEFENIRFLLPK
jgi:general secretion pathway protein B